MFEKNIEANRKQEALCFLSDLFLVLRTILKRCLFHSRDNRISLISQSVAKEFR